MSYSELLSRSQQIAFAVAPKPFNVLSMCCSLYLIRNILSSSRRNQVYHRLILALMILNLLVSICFFVGTWALPSDTGFFLASGSKLTCRIQGSVIQFSIFAIFLYFSMLGLFSYISISCNFDDYKLRQYEPWFHFIIITWSSMIVVIANVKGFINPSGPWCFINRHPIFCEGDECQHDNMNPYITAATILYVSLLLFATFMMIGVCLHVNRRSKNISKLLGKRKLFEESKLQLIKIVQKQCLLFITCLYIGFGSSLVFSSLQCNFKTKTISFQMTLFANITACLPGIFVAIVYETTRYRKKKPTIDISPTRNTLVCDIQRSIRLTECNKDKFTDDRLKKEDECDSGVTFSIFDGSEVSTSPWAEFLFPSGDFDDHETPETIGNEDDSV